MDNINTTYTIEFDFIQPKFMWLLNPNGTIKTTKQINDLERIAVDCEDYELAAEIRDYRLAEKKLDE